MSNILKYTVCVQGKFNTHHLKFEFSFIAQKITESFSIKLEEYTATAFVAKISFNEPPNLHL